MPAPRAFHALAYDTARDQVVMFGGVDSSETTFFDETWLWNASGWQCAQPTNRPAPRTSLGLVYDAARGNVVLFGGLNATQRFGDTWTWNGVGWTRRSVTGPPPLDGHAMIYDESSQVVLLWGGRTATGVYSDAVWEWDGTQWTECTGAARPSARFKQGFAYDSMRNLAVGFGGENSSGRNDETWTRSSASGAWLNPNPMTAPQVRGWHSLAYDPTRDRTLLFGGRTGSASGLGDTWEWDGSEWLERTPTTSPQPRHSYGLVYAGTHGTILFGGREAGNTRAFGDTWRWDGSDWQNLDPPQPTPTLSRVRVHPTRDWICQAICDNEVIETLAAGTRLFDGSELNALDTLNVALPFFQDARASTSVILDCNAFTLNASASVNSVCPGTPSLVPVASSGGQLQFQNLTLIEFDASAPWTGSVVIDFDIADAGLTVTEIIADVLDDGTVEFTRTHSNGSLAIPVTVPAGPFSVKVGHSIAAFGGGSVIASMTVRLVAESTECWLLLGAAGNDRTLGLGDTLLVSQVGAIWPVTIPTVPVLPIPNIALLSNVDLYFQVAMFNPQAFPTDPLQLSNGLKATIDGPTLRYGQSSGLDLWAPMNAVRGQPFQPAFRINR